MNLTRYPHTAHQMEKFTLEEREEIRQMKKQPNLYHKMARSIAPRIFGHDDIKRGILLMLFGGRLPQQFKHTHANIIRRPQTRPHTDSHAVVESRLQIHTCTDTHTHTHTHTHAHAHPSTCTCVTATPAHCPISRSAQDHLEWDQTPRRRQHLCGALPHPSTRFHFCAR